MSAPFHIVIAGGGTAGWMAANLMAHHWADGQVKITLIESTDVGAVGVGEGSTPTLRRFFTTLGIAERDWMPECHATYKVNIRFTGWSPASGVESYAHPFISQTDTFTERPFYVNCQTRRLGLDVTTSPAQFLLNGHLAANNMAPVTPPHFPFNVEYGYHFDSGKLGTFLKNRAIKQGVNHKLMTISAVECDDEGHISALTGEAGEHISADFFIDCTGFRSRLHQQALGVPFRSFEDNLLNDRAVVIATPPLSPLPVETSATALSAGWAWQIPLTHRTGNGYVYSSRFISDKDAESELRTHLGVTDEAAARLLSMRVGQVEQHWYKNCLALGLAQGFIEPLEATALHLVQVTLEQFLTTFTPGATDTRAQASFNADMLNRFERVRDYIVAHYKLTTRDDTAYWRANRSNNVLSDSLRHLLDVWFRQGDLGQEIQRQQLNTHFGTPSWHCLLAGYGTFPPLAPNQPGKGDLYVDNDFETFFTGCMMNFQPHEVALAALRTASND